MKKYCLFVLLALPLWSCLELDLEKEVLNCVERIIKELIKETPRYATVWEWKIDGKSYYYIPSSCCDQLSYLYDDNCNRICAPDGGINGKDDMNCPQFNEDIDKTLVWIDTRDVETN